ncbi:MAG: TetR/AcrR family transcriptional regulator [Spirochaetota bacterium]
MLAKKKVKKTSKVGRPSKKAGITVRQDLILAGVEILKTTPLEEFSLRKVAAHAGVSHVAMYHHFADKNDLLAEIAEIGFQDYFTLFNQELEKVGDDFVNRYNALGWTYFQFIMNNQQYAKIMFGGMGKSHPKLSSISRKTYRQLHETIRLGQNLGFIQKGHTREKTLASWAIIHGFAMLFLEGRLKPKQNPQEMQDFIRSVTKHVYIGMTEL